MSLFSRYIAGEHEAVWREIRIHPNAEASANSNILDVAKATMDRVQTNATLISERLANLGWRPLDLGDCELLTDPSRESGDLITALEAAIEAPAPLALKAFWREVGGINWVWDYSNGVDDPDLGPDIAMPEMDPLCISSPNIIAMHLEEWERVDETGSESSEPRFLILSPDHLVKANISGGEPYSIDVRSPSPDPVLQFEAHEVPFTDYLRLAFRWAGFPGLERHVTRDDVQDFLRDFRSDLIDF